jgi:hypothetical protein
MSRAGVSRSMLERFRRAIRSGADLDEFVADEWVQTTALLREARDLLYHSGSHVRSAEGGYPPCPGCDLEARIDEALA